MDNWAPFDLLPDELAIEMLAAVDDIKNVINWSCTSRRHRSLGNDPALWRRMYERRFAAPLHADFVKRGKDWRWLYRARACDGRTIGTTVGEIPFYVGELCGTYRGDLVEGVPHGYGLLIPKDHPDQYYEGDFCKGRVRGHGVRVWDSGHQHEGAWLDGQQHGHGVYTWPDGSRYEGGWKKGKHNGHGVLTQADGSRYEGDWKGNKRHGRGVQTLANGDRYEGGQVKDAPHGQGIALFADGSGYRGAFANGHYHGYGVLARVDGQKIRGQWLHGRLRRYPLCQGRLSD
jgi:hypothetical protein